MQIRDAREDDLPSILEIYNHEIVNSTSVYAIEPVDLENRRAWFVQRASARYPVLVAEHEGKVIGFASFGDWRAWPGYAHTVEHSVYVDVSARGNGAGRALLQELIERARAQGKHVMVGGIDAANAASLAFHERLGFAEVAHFHEVGRKFGRWLDLIFVELRL